MQKTSQNGKNWGINSMIRANLRNLIIEYPDHDNLLKQNELNKIKELLLSFKKLDSDVRDGSIEQGSVANN